MTTAVLFDYIEMRSRLFRLLTERVNKLFQYHENLTSHGTLIMSNKLIKYAKLEDPGINDMKWFSPSRTEYQNKFTKYMLKHLEEETNVYFTSI